MIELLTGTGLGSCLVIILGIAAAIFGMIERRRQR